MVVDTVSGHIAAVVADNCHNLVVAAVGHTRVVVVADNNLVAAVERMWVSHGGPQGKRSNQ